MINFHYQCNKCGDSKTSKDMESFICDCGGEYKIEHGVMMSVFQPYYSREMKTMITSPKHEDRELRKRGLAFLHDHRSLKQEAAYIRKHKIEHVKAKYAEIGVKFKPKEHDGKQFDEKKGEFVKSLATAVLLLLLSTNAFSYELQTVDVEVNGVKYTVPIGNESRKQDLYFLKKALNGDSEARDIFLGGEDKRYFPIGFEKVTWLVVEKDKENVIIP